MDLSVSVIGTVFIDCKGFACNKYYPDGRNLGDIEFVHGGVGRNVAENLSRMDLPVKLIASVDNSSMGQEVIGTLKEKKVDTEDVMRAEKDGMGMWLAIINEQGDLAGSISKMPDLSLLGELIKTKGESIIANSSHVILELDLNSKLTRNVLDLCIKLDKPAYGIPGNLDIIMKNLDLLPNLECFICNDFEAGQIINKDLTNLPLEEIKTQLEKLFFTDKLSSRYSVVTLGSLGSIYYNRDSGETGYRKAIETKVVDTSGAGDAFFSGTVAGLIKGLPLKDAVLSGTKVASWTISSNKSICSNLRDKEREDNCKLFAVQG